MMRIVLPLVLCSSLLFSGCASWNVNAFGVPVNRTEHDSRPTANSRPPLPSAPLAYYAASDDFGKLSKEEKWGVVLIIGVAVAAAIIFAVNA